MKPGPFTALILISVFALLCAMLVLPLAKAAASINVSWYITNNSGVPVDGARLTIYWSTSPNGPFTEMPADDSNTWITDKVNGAAGHPPMMSGPKQNPIISGYWNPDHPHGMAVASVHPDGILSRHWFYVKIEFDAATEYWPQMRSIKPGDSDWAPVAATGSPSGYAASGNGLGNGPTTAYPNVPPPPQYVPEVPLGPTVATVSMVVGLVGYVGMRRRKAIGFP